MVAWEIKEMGGTIPRTDDRLIGDNMAVASVNVDLTSGKLVGLPQAQFLIDLSGELPVVERAYRFPPDASGDTVWLPLPSRYSCVVRSPLANDTNNRIYWTNPGDPAPWFNTQAGIKAGTPAFNLGIIQPTGTPTIDSVTGGTPPPDAENIDRSYVYTYVDQFGSESSPSPASAIASGPPDATWVVGNLPTTVPANPAGLNYPAIQSYHLYRTITGQTTGAQFYYVATVNLPATSSQYTDSQPDSTVVYNEVLVTVGWGNAPTGLDGLCSMPGGFLCGFTGNTVHFSEPDQPHTWPSVYDQSVHYNIVALAVWQQYLMVMTQGFPSAGSGNMPSNFIFVGTNVAEPCVARGSVVVDMSGVYYASHNGLIQFTGYGMQNITAQVITKMQWVSHYKADQLISCRHRTQFMSINGTNTGFIIDYGEVREGVEDLSTMQGVVCIWNDEFTGETLMCAGGKIYQWDEPVGGATLTYRWRSKQFFTPLPISLGAAQVELDPQVLSPPPTSPPPLDNGDPLMQLPPGATAVFNYYAGPKLQLIMSRNLTKQMEIFRLPNGFKAFDHQVEILAHAPVTSIQVATTLEELKRV